MNIDAKILNETLALTDSNNTLKGRYTTIKWSLSQDVRIFQYLQINKYDTWH